MKGARSQQSQTLWRTAELDLFDAVLVLVPQCARLALILVMFFCSISGEPPQDPVISQKSGHVYERRLILKYITENSTDPITGEKLEESDLITVKASMFITFL